MTADKITLCNFRNIENAEITFGGGINAVYGKNAQGKTNLLEAVYFFARGKSFRGATDREMVRFGAEGYRLSLHYSDSRRQNLLESCYYDRKKQRSHNNVKLQSTADMIGRFNAVFFCPGHLGIVKGAPAERREFLDIAIAQTDPLYVEGLCEYKSALENRNALIRKMKDENRERDALYLSELESWSLVLSKYAARTAKKRESYVAGLMGYAPAFLYEMTGGEEKLSLMYSCGFDCPLPAEAELEAMYQRKMTESLQREIAAGTTLWGTHRDELEITINDKQAKCFASQGQQRSATLALKLSEGELCKNTTGEYPVFLLDDVLSELDEKRRKYLLTKAPGKQIILTSCEKLDYGGEMKLLVAQNGFFGEMA